MPITFEFSSVERFHVFISLTNKGGPKILSEFLIVFVTIQDNYLESSGAIKTSDPIAVLILGYPLILEAYIP